MDTDRKSTTPFYDPSLTLNQNSKSVLRQG